MDKPYITGKSIDLGKWLGKMKYNYGDRVGEKGKPGNWEETPNSLQ